MSTEAILSQQENAPVRRWPRFKMEFPVRLLTQDMTKVVVPSGQGSELNNGGMSVSAGTELPIGAQLLVEFTPPDSSNLIRVRCFVRNRCGRRHGVEFITESDDDYESVHQIEGVLAGLKSSEKESSVSNYWH